MDWGGLVAGLALSAGAAFAGSTSLKACTGSAGGFSYVAEGVNYFSNPTSTSRRWTGMAEYAKSGTQMGGDNKVRFRLSTGTSALTTRYDESFSGYARNATAQGSPNYTVSNAASVSELLRHDADMDAVLALRATCQISWSY